MEALFGMASLALAATILIAARIWFKDRPAAARPADFLSMIAACVATGFIALGVGSLTDFVFRASGVSFWVDVGLVLLGAMAIATGAIFVGTRIGRRRPRSLA